MKTAIVLLALLAFAGAVVWMLQRRLIYFPSGRVPDPLEVGMPPAAEVTFPAADGVILHGWLTGRPETARFTVIVFNGNAGNRAYRAPLARALASRGMAVLLFDYRGFGGSSGAPTEGGLRADARAARDVILKTGVDPRRLVYFGESLGSAIATELAAAHPPAALILRSPFTSLAEVGKVHYRFLPVSWLLRDRFDTLQRIPQVRAPLLVIAGDRDTIVPLTQSRSVFERANEPKSLLIVAGADHNDSVLLAGPEMIDAITTFVTEARQ